MKRIAAFREKHKDILENLLPSDEKTAFTEYGVVTVLKDRDHKGRRVLVVNSGCKFDLITPWSKLSIAFCYQLLGTHQK